MHTERRAVLVAEQLFPLSPVESRDWNKKILTATYSIVRIIKYIYLIELSR